MLAEPPTGSRWTGPSLLGTASVYSCAIALTLLTISVAAAHTGVELQEEPASQEITEMSIEQLLQVEIYSASRRVEPLSDTAAAAFVLSADDIRRSGATTIPEALRMVPGSQVARIDANKWAITSNPPLPLCEGP